MRYFRRVVSWLVLATATNFLWCPAVFPGAGGIVLAAAALTALVIFHFRPLLRGPKPESRQYDAIQAGYELVLAATAVFIIDIPIWIWIGMNELIDTGRVFMFVLTIVIGLVLITGLSLNGSIRLSFNAGKIGVTSIKRTEPSHANYLFSGFHAGKLGFTSFQMLQSAWIPVVNMVSANGVRKECEALRIQLERRELPPSQMCATRYPLLLVHGIFFRDWPNFNYWGRIPERLLNNGATIYYGNQQSADTVQDSAAELAAEIARITAETGCEKVNIIAHSKGGLDARYAISQLGMADKVASLTTVNTPHRGCNYARKLMERIPSAAINAMDGRYEAIFTRLGDPDPNFLGGIVDLTDTECARLNALMPDAPGVRYQSVGSQIESVFAIGFPFNIGYSLIYPIEGPNDGLVATSSMAWGDFLGIVTSTEKKGISHADMIDLTRKDVPGFDVCGFYQTLVAELKSRGL